MQISASDVLIKANTWMNKVPVLSAINNTVNLIAKAVLLFVSQKTIDKK